MATCCSLDTLSSAELEAIRDDYILVGCRVCNADIQQPIHLQVLSQTLKVPMFDSSIEPLPYSLSI